MVIQYCSDLHLELPANKKFIMRHPIKPVGEVLVMAGDIMQLSTLGQQQDFIDYVADNFEMVYWVPGNHEYYENDLGEVADPLLEKIRTNVWMINNQSITYKEVNFICTALWSNINPINAGDIEHRIADFSSIRWQRQKFTAQQFNDLHRKSFSFLQGEIARNKNAKNIIVTHHVPTLLHYPQRYRNNPLNAAFVTEMHDFIDDSGAAYWVYGHHHSNIPSFIIGTTSVITNQLGYVHHKEQQGYRADACVDLS